MAVIDKMRDAWNGMVVDVCATVGTITAVGRLGKANVPGVYKIGVLPANALLLGVTLVTTVEFDAASTIGLGPTEADPDTWGAAVDCKAAGAVVGTAGLNVVKASNQDILATIDFGASTKGEVQAVFHYIDLGSRTETFTA